MSTFLLEIGTEELPADFARLAVPQLQALVARDLDDQRLSHGRLEVTSTPRRLAVVVDGLPACQSERREERKGPPASQGFKDGVPTQAALGFARRCGVEPAALEVRPTAKGPFVFARLLEPGRPTREVLTECIPAWIQGLQGRRFMRWGEGDFRFSRPVRWLVALLDAEVLPVWLPGSDPEVRAGRLSRGHRLHPQPVPIAAADQYGASLAAAGLEVHRQLRAERISQGIQRAAEALEGRPDLPGDLLEELTDLVEQPLLLQGALDPAYLALPAEVLCTVMRAHQRYVPLYRRNAAVDPLAFEARDVLLPAFLCVGNGSPDSLDTVRRGNERVLRARLADARFFLEADRAVSSLERREQLARVTFAEGLGSLRDRVERLEWCSQELLQALALPPDVAEAALRAAHLCKHDLVSQMVGEFPELQGIMGAKYLLAEGEPRAVALAVLEHYLPRGAADALPHSAAGAVVALAERLELLFSIFAKGERPSGSSDPYGLRRAGNGLLQILWQQGWRLDLQGLLLAGSRRWASLFPEFRIEPAALAADLGDFLAQRIASLLEEEGLAADLVAAVAGAGLPRQRLLADPGAVRQRGLLLRELRQQGRLAPLQAVVTRATRLAEKGALDQHTLSPEAVVEPALFEKPSEAAMLAVLQRLEPLAKEAAQKAALPGLAALAAALQESAAALAAFFDGDSSVMVMAEDSRIRSNRLALLSVLRNQASVLADFSALQA
ncbi:glycine--tRNA ligase subunit beta [Cyanobium sp. LEGE 06113]|uniref:glycine--tRNA ligase subunit beta n=1 Tax=Cyanobium sp. LEGE 06113 TaxID=1297573 RepID=UPI001881BC9C|nr:glycine--tRNA ligase subunit beta [Cyanobium sp. LEGE 06113]